MMDVISERPEQELTNADLDHLFSYHAPSERKKICHGEIDAAAKMFAHTIRDMVPPGPNRTVAVRKLQELRMACNLAIALASEDEVMDYTGIGGPVEPQET